MCVIWCVVFCCWCFQVVRTQLVWSYVCGVRCDVVCAAWLLFCVCWRLHAGMCLKVCGVCGRASPIAQLVERVAVNRKVAGSNPAGREASPFTAPPHHTN